MLAATANNASGVLLYAKQRDSTSFNSLWTIKHALHTTKVGHTGTLDSFADGLLVVLVGRVTRLVSHVTAFDKSYDGIISFGSETDTLDPTGDVIKKTPLPKESDFRNAVTSFIGDIMQTPPAFSAIHVDGKRASELAVSGITADIPARLVHIYEFSIKDICVENIDGENYVRYAYVHVKCSKGTYIRSLARDVALACGSCAHLAALRRLTVGPFSLNDAVFVDRLPEFSISNAIETEKKYEAIRIKKNQLEAVKNTNLQKTQKSNEEKEKELYDFSLVKSALKVVTADVVSLCGFYPVKLNSKGCARFNNGQPLNKSCFVDADKAFKLSENKSFAAFYDDYQFAGVINKDNNKLSYAFVIPHNDFPVYSWEDIVNGKFPDNFKSKGTALTIGSFDGPHIGHEALFSAVLSKKKYACGVVTFTRSLRGIKDVETYGGDITTLSQRLELCRKEAFDFAIVIDFSTDFGRMEGRDFFKLLVEFCNLRFLAEGFDFRCGYRGATDVNQIEKIGQELGFDTEFVPPVLYEGQRVSSSLIRQYIMAADFSPVTFLLRRPFSYDASSLDWKLKETCSDFNVYTAKRDSFQVMPPDGTYKIQISLFGNDDSPVAFPYIYRTSCVLEEDSVKIFLDKAYKTQYVRTIIFIEE
ncbi:MAG: tRNA pseudouridine(55) synthase TruB [Treponema sp.]|nr:tRNA pseudouridine(55) synthase TruB [Treponema sp.]